jgi:PAS domain S-box-containing protein
MKSKIISNPKSEIRNPQSDALRILILEDVPTDAELVERELRKADIAFTSRCVDTREGLLKELEDFSPDIILSDYSMPQFTGMEALEIVKELYPEIPFIIVTGSLNEETAVECMKAGADDYLIKENLTRLGRAVHGAMEMKAIREEKEQAEKALRENERYFRSMIHNLHEDILVVDRDYRITDVNNLFLITADRKREDVVGSLCYEILHSLDEPCDNQGKGCPMLRVFATGVPSRARHQHVRDGGLESWVDILYSPLKDDEGNVTHIIEAVRDLTDLVEMEEALRKSEKRFRNLVETTSDWVWEVDENAVYTYVSPKIRDLLGYEPEEILGKTPFDLMLQEEARRVTDRFDSIIASREPFECLENTNLHKDGRHVILETSGVPIFDAEGRFCGYRGMDRDITERKLAENALHESEEKYRLLVANANDAIFIAQDEVTKFPNPQTEELVGYSAEELAKIPFVDLIHSEEREMVHDRHLKRMRGEEFHPSTYSFRIIPKSGEELWVQLNATPITWEGRPATLNFLRDITQEKKLETQLLQSQKMEAIGTLAGGVAHDFNNLLTTIMGNSHMALMDLDKDSPLREEIEGIKEAGERATSLTRQLLAFSRKQVFQPKVLVLNEVLANIEKMLARLIGEHIELEIIPCPGLYRTKVDPGQIEQVIMNLAVNSRDAMPRGGKLIIETAKVDLCENYFRDHAVEAQPGPYVMLAVSDTGIGMDEEIRSHIFEPFYTTKEKGRGTGLGLSTVYGIVKQSGGFIWTYSEPGQGTTFKIYLPSVEEDVVSEEKEITQTDEMKGSETILVVEDDDMLRKIAQKALQLYAYRVLEAKEGVEALRVCEEHQGPIHLILTDVVMPGMGGRELAEQLQSLRPEIKVLYMSGYTDDAIVHHGVLAPGVNFIEKPFLPEALAKKVREVLDR